MKCLTRIRELSTPVKIAGTLVLLPAVPLVLAAVAGLVALSLPIAVPVAGLVGAGYLLGRRGRRR